MQFAQRIGAPLPDITVGMRTGDTPANRRKRQRENPPNLLLTTPESLALTSNMPVRLR